MPPSCHGCAFLREKQQDGAFVAKVLSNRRAAIPGIFFCAMWGAFAAVSVWYGIAILHVIGPTMILGLMQLGVGLFITHAVFSALLNDWTMRMTSDRFVANSGPIPLNGHLDIPLSQIESFGIIDSRGRGKNCSVSILFSNGKWRKVATGRTDMASAKFIAARLNDALSYARHYVRIEQPFRAAFESEAGSESDDVDLSMRR